MPPNALVPHIPHPPSPTCLILPTLRIQYKQDSSNIVEAVPIQYDITYVQQRQFCHKLFVWIGFGHCPPWHYGTVARSPLTLILILILPRHCISYLTGTEGILGIGTNTVCNGAYANSVSAAVTYVCYTTPTPVLAGSWFALHDSGDAYLHCAAHIDLHRRHRHALLMLGKQQRHRG